MMKKLFGPALAAALLVGAAGQAQAAQLQLTDAYGTLWTLDVATGCTTCAVSLTADFSDPSGEAGWYLDAVQFKIGGYAPNSDSDIGFSATNAGGTSDWDFTLSNLNANQCKDVGGDPNSVCGEWVSGGTGGGYGPIVAGSSLYWDFSMTFPSELTSLVRGNIRAAFNDSTGKNVYIYSPGDGTFDGDDGGQDGGGAPEPGMLLLLGTGLVLAGARLRKRQ